MSARRWAAVAALSLVVASVAVFAPAALQRSTARAFDPAKAPVIQRRLLSGLADYEFNSSGEVKGSATASNYVPHGDDACERRSDDNVKVNQNCLNITDADLQGRAQAQNETSIAVDALDKSHIVASFNDYRRGDGNCYGAYSLDEGKTWSDTTLPMGFTRGTAYGGKPRQYWQAGGDTSVAWDTKGNAYLSCQMFSRGAAVSANPDLSTALFVFRSTANNGASWNFPARPVIERPDPSGTGTAAFLDKQLMTVDDHVGSPFQDRIYVTWTTFAVDGTAYIYGAYSNDYGETFSAPVVVSRGSSLCGNTFGLPTPHGRCNENQFSQPFTGSDGALYVAWANFNNVLAGPDNRAQILLAKSTDGGASFSAPVKVGDYYDLPDCDTYQGAGANPFRACVPEKGSTSHSIFRASNYPSGVVNPTNPSQVIVNYGSYINQYSKGFNDCSPSGFAADGQALYSGVKTPGACNNKILLSVSNDAGASFTGGAGGADPRTQATVNTPAQAGSNQWWQWTAMSNDGRLAVSYYDRQHADNESTGYMDFTLSGSTGLVHFGSTRVTTSSMPPPTQFSGQFFGDYTGLDAVDEAHPLWMDTRSVDLFLCPGTGTPGIPPEVCTATVASGFQMGLMSNDEEIVTASVGIPPN